MTEYRHEAVEVCSHCMGENTVPDWAPSDGYRVKCSHCGESILLCDECMHALDNLDRNCDWDNTTGKCFRDYKKEENAMLKTNCEPDLTMTNAWLAQLYDEEIHDVEGDIQNEAIWAIASTTDWEHDMHLQNVADKQAYLEKLKELRDETSI